MKRFNKILSILLVLAIMVPGIVNAVPVAESKSAVERLAGETRIGTALEASKKVYEKSDTVVLVGYEGVVDALTGTILAHGKDAPVLITQKDSVPKEVKDELKRLKVKNIIVIGGKNVVSEGVISELKDYSVKRIDGLNRAETAANVAKEVNSDTKHVFLALGYEKLADALAIGPASAKEKSPVLLTQTDKIPKETMEAMENVGVTHVTIVGGDSAVNKDVEKLLAKYKVNRVSGDRREDTALEIAAKYFPKAKKSIIAYGWKYADALVGGYIGAKMDAPILLTNTNSISDETLRFLKEKIEHAYVLGGIQVVSGSVFNKIVEVVSSDKDEMTLTVLATTDVHGNIYNWSYEDEKETKNSGLAKVNTVVEQVRAENPNTILVDAGDLIQGTILTDEVYSKDLENINPMIDMLNFMKYDAMVLGNHEFNFGMPTVDKLMKDAKFPVLSANIFNKSDDTSYAKPYTIVERSGLRVGILGLSTPNIPRWDGDKVKNLEFIGMDKAADIYIKEIEKENVDLIVTVAHAGLDKEYIDGDDMRTVIEKHPQIDASIVGHTHSSVKETVGTTIVGGAQSNGREVIRIDINLKKMNNEWKVIDKTVDLINVEKYKASDSIKEYAKVYHETTLEFISEVLGEASGDFRPESEIKGIPEAQIRDTAVMDLINKIQLKDSGADVSAAALFSSTSNIKKGPITYADIFDIYKFPNTLVMVEASGKELVNYMEWSVKYYNTYKDGDISISFNPSVRAYLYDMFAGVDYKIDLSKPAGERITDLKLNGKEVKADDTIKLVVNDYRYSGLKSQGILTGEPIYESAPVSSRELIAKHIEELGTINPDVDNNWEITGIDLNHVLRDYIIKEVNEGRIELPKSEDGRTPNVKALNVYELIKDGKIPAEVLKEHGLDSQGNPL